MMLSLKSKLWIYIVIVLSSLSFYNPLGIIPSQLSKFIFYALSFYAIWVASKNGYPLDRIDYPQNAYKLLIFGVISSIFMVVLFQEQSFIVTSVATLPFIFSYLLFYVLLRFAIPKELVERTLLAFAAIGMCIYVINMITFPQIVFGIGEDEYDSSRGVVRLEIPSILLVVFCFFYSINKWILAKQKEYIWLIVLSYIFIFLSVARQVILFSTIFGILFIMQKASWPKKILVIMLSLFLILFALPRTTIYQSLVEVSKVQAERNMHKEDVRIRAWRFYTYEYQTNAATVLFGNGIPAKGKSRWADKHWHTVSYEYGGNGCFTVDVGWAGFFWDFGLLATAGLLTLMLKAMLKKKRPDRQYLSYWCLYIICTAIASGPILFSNQIVNIVTVLYLVYGKEVNSNYYSKLQQYRSNYQLH